MHAEDRGRVDLQVRVGRLERTLAAERKVRLWMVVGAAILGAVGTASVTRLLSADPAPVEHARVDKKMNRDVVVRVSPPPSPAPTRESGSTYPWVYRPSSIGQAQHLVRLAHDAMDDGDLGRSDHLLDAADQLVWHEEQPLAFLMAARGRHLWESGRYEDSLRILEGGMAADATFPDAYLYRAMSESGLGDRPGACADLRRFLALAAAEDRDRDWAQSELRRLGCH